MLGIQKFKCIPNIWNGLYSSIRPHSFRPVLLKLPHAHKSSGGILLKYRFWSGVWDPAFLTCSQEKLMLLTHGLQFESQGFRELFHHWISFCACGKMGGLQLLMSLTGFSLWLAAQTCLLTANTFLKVSLIRAQNL